MPGLTAPGLPNEAASRHDKSRPAPGDTTGRTDIGWCLHTSSAEEERDQAFFANRRLTMLQVIVGIAYFAAVACLVYDGVVGPDR